MNTPLIPVRVVGVSAKVKIAQLGEAREKGSVHTLRHKYLHVFSGLRGGEAFKEEFQVGLGLNLIGLGGFHQ
jgi:hypothetical protein